MRCEEVRETLPAYAKEGPDDLNVRRHLSGCPDCKAELARYESLMGRLRTLQKATVDPPASLARSLYEIPQRASRLDGARDHIVRNRKAYVGGAAVALAGAAGAVLWRARARRPIPA